MLVQASLLLVLVGQHVSAYESQAVLGQAKVHNSKEKYYRFPHPIRRVAVIGAGPSGLQSAAVLRDHRFEVRLFDRSPGPGGNWYDTPEKALPSVFPDQPLKTAAYVPDIPHTLPRTHVFSDGEGGISNSERWREHWNPSPVWEHLRSNSAPVFTTLPEVNYRPDVEWSLSHHDIRRHVRQYASYKGLNSNDAESHNITSYSTRVERLTKSTSSPHRWVLTLRKYELLPHHGGKILAEWWSEEVDAVVVATGSYDSSHVPPIPNLDGWASAFPKQVYHSREYRHPEDLKGKNVLIVGASISASEIARDLSSHVRSFSISIRDHERNTYSQRRSLRRLPANITHLPEIRSFSRPNDISLRKGVAGASIQFVNGSTIDGFDEIILATGFRRSNPFLADFHNSTIIGAKNPDVEVPPILTDGSHLRSLHWTGHYIPDPTLAFTNVRSWTLGTFQSLVFAKTWSGKGRLPNTADLWEEYPGPRRSRFVGGYGSLGEEALQRQYVTWLNNESLEFGGRLVAPLPVENRETFVYYAEQAWEAGYTTSENFTRWENVPRSEWNITGAGGSGAQFVDENGWIEEDW